MRLARAFDRGLELRALQMDSLVQRLEHPADRIALRRDRLAAATRALARAGMRARADRDTGLKQLLHRLQRARPATGWLSERTRSLALRLDRTGSEAIASRRARLQSLGQALLHLNPARVLDRGFGIVIDSRGHVVSEAASAAPGDRLSVRLSRGELDVRVEQVMPPTA
jgi:exodeoxyribonuclease VII large subunit